MKSLMQGSTARGRTRPVIAGLLAVMSAAGAVGVAAAAQGDDGDFRAVGPISTQNGYPIWYADKDGTEVELCLDGTPLCRFLPGDVPDANNPISFPGNFPGEAFWWAGESVIEDGLTKKVVLVMAAEAAFASGEVAKPGDQVSFGRVRVRMDDVIPGATYHITHPYGEVDLEADEDGRVFATSDIGALTTPADFSLALDSPVFDGLLEWDPAVSAPPAGYLGDPGVDHKVIGSTTGTNVFRVEGPPGSFGLNQACPGVTDGSCVENDLFSIVGKRPVISGVQTMRAVRVDHGDESSDYLEVFVNSRAGQKIMLSGVGIATTQMIGTTTGRGDLYYAKVLVPGSAPVEVVAKNETDGTSWTSKVTDLVDATSAQYDLTTGTLNVAARSSVAGVTLTAVPGGALAADGTLSVKLPSPPLNVVVKSSAGGSATEPLRLVGADVQSAAVTAAASASLPTAIPGQTVQLSASTTGDILSYKWKQISGPTVDIRTAGQAVAKFDAPAVSGALTFKVTVTGLNGSIAMAEVTVNVVADQVPVANAGPDKTAIVGTIVTLDGSASMYGKNYTWEQINIPTGATPVVLTGADTAIATFVMPDATKPLEFKLKAKAGPDTAVTDTMLVTKVNEVLAITRAELRTREGQLRVEGTSTLFSVPNVVTFYASDGVAKTHAGKVLGTITVDPLGAYAFRADGVTLPAGVTRIDVFTSRGGVLENVPLTIRN